MSKNRNRIISANIDKTYSFGTLNKIGGCLSENDKISKIWIKLIDWHCAENSVLVSLLDLFSTKYITFSYYRHFFSRKKNLLNNDYDVTSQTSMIFL